MTTADKLISRRKTIKTKLERIFGTVNNHDINPLSLEDAECDYDSVLSLEKKYESIQDNLLEMLKDDEVKAEQELISESFDSMFRNAKTRLKKILSQLMPKPVHGNVGNHQSQVKLPSIDLPTFDGKLENWITFKDLFTATVANNANLSGAQKMQYLMSSMRGEAISVIKSLQISDDNYDKAWDIVNDRYNNKREIVTSILNRLYDQPTIEHESASLLQQLLDTTTECRRSLEVLNRPVQYWDDLLVHLIVRRLDPESKRRWAMSLKGDTIPTFKELHEFMEQVIRGLLAGGVADNHLTTSSHAESNSYPNKFKFNNKPKGKKISANYGSTTMSCPVCKGSHFIYKCEKFLSLAPSKRNKCVTEASLCYNCLRSGHSFQQCKSQFKCKKCKGPHNTLLHRDQPQVEKQELSQPNTVTSNYSASVTEAQVLLATAVVNIKDSKGAPKECRVLLDGGSQASFISEQCVSSLGLKRSKTHILIKGIGNSNSTHARGQVCITLISRINGMILDVEALILPKVTGNLPSIPCSSEPWIHIKGLPLADPTYYRPGQIDVLLGADYVAAVMTDGKRVGDHNTPIAQNTIFGWILSGRISSGIPRVIQTNLCDVEKIIQKFWQLEELPKVKHLTPEEKQCEDHFNSTHQRKADGRYVVQLPTKSNINNLGESRQSAVARLNQVQRRLASNPERQNQYSNFIKEFLDLNHMENVPEDPVSQSANIFYLPHHCVIKENSSTTKLRVVFDGSAKSSSGLSLNDCIMVGPTVQDDLYSLLLRFRLHVIALKADITKMYRQFEIADCHKDFQRIVWRDSTTDQIQDFRITRVTYGTASAPYLATRCLQQLAKDEKQKYPEASQVLANDFYVDDLMSGESSPDRASHLQQQLTALLKAGGMELCKWATNNKKVLESIPIKNRETVESLTLDPDDQIGVIKALGVQWHPHTDSFSFCNYAINKQEKITKRIMLSELAKVFDPIGFLSPFTIRAKILFQDLWKIKLDWDEILPMILQQQWNDYVKELGVVSEISIPRCLVTSTTVTTQLHGFSDGSEKAYGAVVYLRCKQNDGTIQVRFITSKTKVAPIKKITIPRMELCGATMLANLLQTVKEAIGFKGESFGWTDSSIVLRWLTAYPCRWKTFVANRVAEIQDLLSYEDWHHVKSEENPADLLTRGVSAEALKLSSLWWSGPDWLSTDSFPINSYDVNKEAVSAEERATQVLVSEISSELMLWERYSSLRKLNRVTAYCLRFINNCKNCNQSRFGQLTCEELQLGLNSSIRQVQQQEFASEIKELSNNRTVSRKSKLFQLAPYIDSSGLLRVGGRLQNAEIPEQAKHPLLLPHHHRLTTLIIQHHHQNLHAGPKLLLAMLQQQFWILRAKDSIRREIRKCVICRRYKATTAIQFMGNLPSPRVNPGRVFSKSGLDYAGPFQLRDRGRGKTLFKYYVCIFVCLCTKAVHLEPVSGLSTEAFLAALKRFIARRGVSSDLYSDCGTNFVGADKELKILLTAANHNNTISHQLADQGINWHFNPPGAPHQGGLWEAAVKSMKFHLRRVMGSTTLTSEEFGTLLCQIESCLNSRPLCACSSDPSDLQPLTPGHFIIGQSLSTIPEPDLTQIKMNRLSRWQMTQQLLQHFWKRWSSEYLITLQQRFQWHEKHRNLQVGELVLIKDDNQPPNKWAMGRIKEIHPGSDKLVRVVTIRTAVGELKRPVTKVCLLLDPDEDEQQHQL